MNADLQPVEWVLGNPLDLQHLIIRKCFGHRLTTQPLWKVQGEHNSFVLAKSGNWEYEPTPSSRDASFYARCRFDTFEEAVEAAKNVISREAAHA